MNSINSGRQPSTFNWYEGKNNTSYKGSVSIPITENSNSGSSLDSFQAYEQKQYSSPLVDSLRPQGSPKESPLINLPLPELKQSVAPLVDVIQAPSSPREPSRIHWSIHSAHKHPYPSDSTDSPLAQLPLKRVKVTDDSSLSSSLDARDFNSAEGSDLVDFSFSRRVPADIINMEEAERADRIKRRVNPVLVGKFSRINKELKLKVSLKPVVIEEATAVVEKATAAVKEATTAVLEKTSGFTESLSEAKDAILEKGQSLIESTKEAMAARMHPLRQSLEEIAVESTLPFSTFHPLLPLYETETIEFVWPRVSESFIAGEEAARAYRLDNKPLVQSINTWKLIHAELLNKLSSRGFGIADKAESMIGRASRAIEGAIHYTAEKMEQLVLSSQGSGHDAEWFRLQEEKERARRINESPLMPSSKINKARVEQQLLDAARRIRTQQ